VTEKGVVVPHGGAKPLKPPAGAPARGVVGIAAAATGSGCWVVDGRGGVHPVGDAPDLAGGAVEGRVVGMAALPGGGGFWLVTDDGVVLPRGSAVFHGSPAGRGRLPHPIVGIAATQTGGGYWLADSDGAVYAFGDAGVYEKKTDALNKPMTGIAAVPTAGGGVPGYWLVGGDGGVFAYPDGPQKFFGSLGSRPPAAEVVGIAATPSGLGYWLADAAGTVHPFGDATALAGLPRVDGRVVGIAAAP
jgi:hypothetical protein